MSTRQLIVFAFVFGAVAAAVVWWLERFEVSRLHGEIRQYLGNYDQFQEWLNEHGKP